MNNIVICCDGTGNEYGSHNTNVVETCVLAARNDAQVVYYDPGIGTGGWEYHEDSGALRSRSDQATGHGLQKNVEDAYRYLMACRRDGDRVYLFGFSRGAFTVRSLAGMLFKCGLLDAEQGNLVEYASKIYNTEDNADVAAGFRQTFARPCPIHFIGVWDTVESLVMNAGKRFHDATLNPEVKFGCHAVSIDERRKDFLPCLWDESHASEGQRLEQVWFPGVHSNVGGWYDERGLSNGALQWMIRKAMDCGMQVDEERLAQYVPNPHDKMHNSYSGFWRIRGSRTRKIPEGALIHRSAVERRDNPGNRYHPRNLPSKFTVVE